MKRNSIILYILLSGIIILNNSEVKAQTLSDYQKIAAQNNPSLKGKYHSYYASLEKIPQVNSLPDPELSFSMFIGKEGLYMERLMGQQLGEISFMQMFPWVGTLGAAKSEATYMAQMKFAVFQEEKINLFHEVRSSWYSLYKINKELKLLEEEKTILKTYEDLALTRFKTGTSGSSPMNKSKEMESNSAAAPTNAMSSMGMGNSAAGSTQPAMSSSANSSMSNGSTGSMIDVLLIQLQIKELETKVELLKASQKPLTVKFNNLLNQSSPSDIIIADTLTPAELPASLSIIQDSIIQNHPMIKMYEWDEKAREAQQRMAVLMGRPMIGVGISYMPLRPRVDEVTKMQMGGDDMVMPMVTLTLPIYRKKFNAQKKEASYYQQAATQNKEYAKLSLLSELESLLYDYESSLKTLSLLNQQIAITQQATRLMITTYSTGGIGMEEILRQRQSLLGFQQQQLNTITQQHITISSITKLMGVDSN